MPSESTLRVYRWSPSRPTLRRKAAQQESRRQELVPADHPDGITFLGMHGSGWGLLNGTFGFAVTTGALSSAYFLMTGFHGAHVTVGLPMLAPVYWRLEDGEYSQYYHMSLTAAGCYWHFASQDLRACRPHLGWHFAGSRRCLKRQLDRDPILR